MKSRSLAARLDARRSGFASVAAVLLVSVVMLGDTAHAGYITTNVPPASITVSWGTTGKQPLSVLGVQDSSGTSVDSSKAQHYTPVSNGYHANYDFTVPQGLSVAAASGLTLTLNYHGPVKAVQQWTFDVRDQVAQQWITVGYNDVPTAETWTTLTFPLSGDLSRFVDSSGGMEARLYTSTHVEGMDLDFVGFAVTTYTPDLPPPPPPGTGVSGVRTVFSGSFAETPDQINFVANFHDLTITGEGPTEVAELHAANPSPNIYHYQKIAGTDESDPAWSQTKNLLWNGPSGKPVYQAANGWYWIDIITPSKRNAWIPILVSKIKDFVSQGYDGVYLDDAGVIDPSLINEYPTNYTSTAYYAAIGSVLAGVRAALPGVEVIINSYTGGAAQGERGLELLAYCDGMSFEAFSMKYSQKFMDPSRWLQQIHDFQYTLAQGKIAIGMDYMASTDSQRRMWSIASYLIANGAKAYHRLGMTDVTSDLQQYPEDSLNIGKALGAAVERSDGLVTRAYGNGTVVANNNTSSKTYSMGSGSWQKLVLNGGGAYPLTGSATWSAISGTSITLAANSAVIVRPAQ